MLKPLSMIYWARSQMPPSNDKRLGMLMSLFIKNERRVKLPGAVCIGERN